jgi:hypothetical protein
MALGDPLNDSVQIDAGGLDQSRQKPQEGPEFSDHLSIVHLVPDAPAQILTFSNHGIPMINSAAKKINPKNRPSVQKAVREMYPQP